MARCKYFRTCQLEDTTQPDDYLCILHSKDPDKNQRAFELALDTHRQSSTNFDRMVFPYETDFSGEHFNKRADFSYAQFLEGATFNECVFEKGANFTLSEFAGDANFTAATLKESAWFIKARFKEAANFWDAKFNRAHFSGTKFEKNSDFGLAAFSDTALFHQTEFRGETRFSDTNFNGRISFSDLIFSDNAVFTRAQFSARVAFARVIFMKPADFEGCVFSKDGAFRETDFNDVANFRGANFFGSTSFTATEESPIFHGGAIFENVSCGSGDSLRLIGTDLQRCKFLGAEARKFYFVGVSWRRIGRRRGVFDEIAPLDTGDERQRQWALVEELYRQLKQNYEDRRDYERAGHFHVGEKEMRLRNPNTPVDLRFLLAIYKWVSGYGENFWMPLFWIFVLLLITSSTALIQGLTLEVGGSEQSLSAYTLAGWGWAILYSIETIVHLPGKGFTASGLGRVISTFTGILGPVLIALFGFALRQRLKR